MRRCDRRTGGVEEHPRGGAAGRRRTGAARRSWRRLFEPPLDADTVRKLLDELRSRMGRAARSSWCRSRRGWRFQGMPAVQTYLDRLVAGEAAALFARGDGNPGDHRLSATRDPRRHRSHPRRRRVHQRRQDAGGPAMGRGGRPPRDAGPPGALRDDQDLPRRPRPAFARRSCLRWPSSTPPTSWRCPMHPPKAAEAHSRSRARLARPPTSRCSSRAWRCKRSTESLPPPRHQTLH